MPNFHEIPVVAAVVVGAIMTLVIELLQDDTNDK